MNGTWCTLEEFEQMLRQSILSGEKWSKEHWLQQTCGVSCKYNQFQTFFITYLSCRINETLLQYHQCHFLLILLPPANEVCEGYVFTGVCLSTQGGACMVAPGGCMVAPGGGGMHGCYRGVCMVAAGGLCGCSQGCVHGCSRGRNAWLIHGDMHGCSRGRHAWLLHGDIHGCSWGACMVAAGGHAWLLPEACVVAPGGVRGCSQGGHMWLFLGKCVWLLPGGHAWFLWGGLHGCSRGMCMVAPRGACVVAPRGHAWDTMRYGDTINERAVHILLECILVALFFIKLLNVPAWSCYIVLILFQYFDYLSLSW